MTACLEGKDHHKIPNEAGKAVAGNSMRRVFFSAVHLVRWTHCIHTEPSSSERWWYNYKMHPCMSRSIRYLLGLKLRPLEFLEVRAICSSTWEMASDFLKRKIFVFWPTYWYAYLEMKCPDFILHGPRTKSLLGISNSPQAPPYLWDDHDCSNRCPETPLETADAQR